MGISKYNPRGNPATGLASHPGRSKDTPGRFTLQKPEMSASSVQSINMKISPNFSATIDQSRHSIAHSASHHEVLTKLITFIIYESSAERNDPTHATRKST